MPDRSIRNIPVSNRPSDMRPNPYDGADFRLPARGKGRYDQGPEPVQKKPRRFLLWALIALVACGLVGAALAALFAGASVMVVPRTASVTPAGVVTVAVKNISVSGSTSRTVPATGTRAVSSPAQGTIVIYNRYSTAPQTLVASTRLASPTGLIYRIHKTVVVPGAKKAADGSLVPGSISTVAYADKPGADYNGGAMQFSIPGFKGKPQYNGFYASTQGMSGGASGSQPAVLPGDLSKAKTDMDAELKTTLTQKVGGQIPAGYLLMPGAFSISYGAVVTQGTGSTATLTESATASAGTVSSSDLASSTAEVAVQGYGGEPVTFANVSQLPIGLPSGASYAPDAQTIDVAFSGPVTLVWQIDPSTIAQALAGKQKSAFDSIMQTFKPIVAKATADLRPFWLSAFPADPAKIKVQIENPPSQ